MLGYEKMSKNKKTCDKLIRSLKHLNDVVHNGHRGNILALLQDIAFDYQEMVDNAMYYARRRGEFRYIDAHNEMEDETNGS